MRSPLRVSKVRGRKVWHYMKCVRTKATARYMRRYLKDRKAWRRSYSGKWKLAWRGLSPQAKGWTKHVSFHESGNRRVAPESGFLSYFQWLMPTWRAACGCSLHPYNASWHHQATVAWFWHLSHPTGQWPNTGE